MVCPVCNAQLSDDATACHVCNAWLGSVAEGDDPFESAPAQPEAGEGGQGSTQAAVHTRIVALEAERDRHTRIVDVNVPAVVRRAAREKERAAEAGATPKQSGDDQWEQPLLDQLQERLGLFYARMHRLDRLTWWALILVALGVFLPWHAVDGAQIEAGIEGFGLVTVIAVALGMACIHWRTGRRRLARKLMMLQLAATALVFAAPVRLAMTTDPKHLKFGVMITTAAGLLATALALIRMLRLKGAG